MSDWHLFMSLTATPDDARQAPAEFARKMRAAMQGTPLDPEKFGITLPHDDYCDWSSYCGLGPVIFSGLVGQHFPGHTIDVWCVRDHYKALWQWRFRGAEVQSTRWSPCGRRTECAWRADGPPVVTRLHEVASDRPFGQEFALAGLTIPADVTDLIRDGPDRARDPP